MQILKVYSGKGSDNLRTEAGSRRVVKKLDTLKPSNPLWLCKFASIADTDSRQGLLGFGVLVLRSFVPPQKAKIIHWH